MASIPDAPDFEPDLGLTDQDTVYLDTKAFEEAHDPRLRFYREHLKDKPAWTLPEVELLLDDPNGLEMTSMDAYVNQVPVVEWAQRYYEKAESVKRAVAAGELQPCPSQTDHFLPPIAVEWLCKKRELPIEIEALAKAQKAPGFLATSTNALPSAQSVGNVAAHDEQPSIVAARPGPQLSEHLAEEDLLKVTQAAKRYMEDRALFQIDVELKDARSTISRACRHGNLKSTGQRQTRRIRSSDLDSWLLSLRNRELEKCDDRDNGISGEPIVGPKVVPDRPRM